MKKFLLVLLSSFAFAQSPNFFYTTLTSGISATDTTISFTASDTTYISSNTSYYATIWDKFYHNAAEAFKNSKAEIVLVNSRSGSTLDVERAQCGTTARVFNTSGRTYQLQADIYGVNATPVITSAENGKYLTNNGSALSWTSKPTDSIATHRTQLNKFLDTNAVYRTQINKFLDTNTVFRTQLNKHIDSVATHRTQLNKHIDSINTHRTVLNNRYDSLAIHRTELNSHLDSIAVHRTQLNKHIDSVATHRTQLDKHIDSVATHRSALNAHTDSITAHRTAINNKTILLYAGYVTNLANGTTYGYPAHVGYSTDSAFAFYLPSNGVLKNLSIWGKTDDSAQVSAFSVTIKRGTGTSVAGNTALTISFDPILSMLTAIDNVNEVSVSAGDWIEFVVSVTATGEKAMTRYGMSVQYLINP